MWAPMGANGVEQARIMCDVDGIDMDEIHFRLNAVLCENGWKDSEVN